jgi:hypothetical protein
VAVKDDYIVEKEIPTWLSERTDLLKNDQSQIFRLLIGSPEEHHSDAEILPLPISCSTYKTVCTEWKLPTELLRMMLSTLPLTVSFDSTDADGCPVTGLILRGARSRDWNFCLGLVHNPAKRTTCGILNGMQQREVEELLRCLKQSTQHIRDPMLLPVFLLELKVHFFALLLEKRAIGIEEIEYSTGMRHGFSTDPRRNMLIGKERNPPAKPLDFDPITQKLTGVTGTLSFCDMTFESSGHALDVLLRVKKKLDANQAGQNLANTETETETRTALSRRMDYLGELIIGSQAHCGVLSARTTAQVQTVYSMIGQRDADASKEIAATSLFHNEAMKEIAEDSRQIAILTRRDSVDMRIIAAVTLVFLPGTFMATMFGSGFFRFFPQDSSKRVVSGWIWLYFVLTVAVTAAVLMFWWYFSKRQNHALFRARQQVQDTVAAVERGRDSGNTLEMTWSRHRSSLRKLPGTAGCDSLPSPATQ